MCYGLLFRQLPQAQFEEAKIKGNADALKEAMAGFIADKIAFKDAEMALAQKDVRAPCSGVVSLRQGGTKRCCGEGRLSESNCLSR